MNNDPKRRLSRPEVSGISAIFNPRKLRRSSTAISQLLGNIGRPPSVVITDDNLGEVDFGGGVVVGHPGGQMVGVGIGGGGVANGPHGHREFTGGGGGGGSGILNAGGGGGAGQCGPASNVPLLADVQQQSGAIITLDSSLTTNPSQQLNQQQQPPGANNNTNLKPIAKTIATIKRAIFSKTARKLCCGVILSILVGCCWTLMIHSIKRAYMTSHLFPADRLQIVPASSSEDSSQTPVDPALNFPMDQYHRSFAYDNNPNHHNIGFNGLASLHSGGGGGGGNSNNNNNNYNFSHGGEMLIATPLTTAPSNMPKSMVVKSVYDAPFFTAWILTISTTLFYPIHQLTVRFCSCMGRKGPKSMSRAISDAIQGFRERGMTLFQFLGRCTVLCVLWLSTNWLLAASLRVLRATEVLSLFATTTSFVYLLSWVVLHQQFVGLRILAVILSNMGIALFAYMDGGWKSKESRSEFGTTVGGVILGATAAAGSAVFKVSLKKSFGFGATISQQVALIFSVVGLLATVIMWPIFLTLYFTGIEVIRWSYVPWELIIYAIVSYLLVSMLDNFGVTCTFEFFITVGLLMAIPFSAVLDRQLYHADFDGMCLAGIITVGIGFIVVLLPENWPDYITRLIRRFRGDVPPAEAEEKHHPNSANTHPRLSRSGLDNLLVNPPNFHPNITNATHGHPFSSHSPFLNHHPSTTNNNNPPSNQNTQQHNTTTNNNNHHSIVTTTTPTQPGHTQNTVSHAHSFTNINSTQIYNNGQNNNNNQGHGHSQSNHQYF